MLIVNKMTSGERATTCAVFWWFPFVTPLIQYTAWSYTIMGKMCMKNMEIIRKRISVPLVTTILLVVLAFLPDGKIDILPFPHFPMWRDSCHMSNEIDFFFSIYIMCEHWTNMRVCFQCSHQQINSWRSSIRLCRTLCHLKKIRNWKGNASGHRQSLTPHLQSHQQRRL